MEANREKLIVENTTVYPITSNIPIPMGNPARMGLKSLVKERVFKQLSELQVGESFLVTGATKKYPTKLFTIQQHISAWKRGNKEKDIIFTSKNVTEKQRGRGKRALTGVRVWRIR